MDNIGSLLSFSFTFTLPILYDMVLLLWTNDCVQIVPSPFLPP